MNVRLSARAAAHVRAIDAWWREHRSDRTAFLGEFDHAVELLRESPDLGALYLPRASAGVRRFLLAASQHYLYYEHRRDQHLVRILAVLSCYRGRGPNLGPLGRR